jgi:protein involved in polysaccharide export with SLBB domain
MSNRVIAAVLLCLFIGWPLSAQEQYVLGPGDLVIIKVYGQDDLELETRLTDSGTINYPFLGKLQLSGKSIKQVETLIYQGLKGDYLVEPNVFVGMVEYRPFYIHGEVKQPGAYPYQPGMTVNQAIALAGGMTERASREKIRISREGDKNQHESGSLSSRILAGDTITIEQRFF